MTFLEWWTDQDYNPYLYSAMETAFNAGIEAAAKVCEDVKKWEDDVACDVCAERIRKLEMK